MKIGTTERGDAGVDFSWHEKLATVDGSLVITKKMSPEFNQLMLTASKPVILHCTCTGRGGTWLEPNVPDFRTQIGHVKSLVGAGFPAERVVIRIDPIIPDREGIERACLVIEEVMKLKIPVTRFRFSVYDEYRHVKQRLRDIGHDPFYPGDAFYASPAQKNAVIAALSQYPYMFESCAEDWAMTACPSHFRTAGCISATDIRLMGLALPDGLGENNQRRSGCHCLSCKTELLTQRRQCPNSCVYCYWKPVNE